MSHPYRLGFAVKVLGGGGLRSHDSRRWQNRPHLSRSLELLESVFDHLDRSDVRMYRLSSSTVPYGTHPDLPEFDYRRQIEDCADELARLGRKAHAYGLRLSTHPGQYTVLSARDDELVRKSSLDLEQDALLLDALGQGPEAVVVVHVGGAYGDEGAALDRWARAYERLSERARARVVVEHDETAFDLVHVLELHRRTGVPVVFDHHHHRCNPAPALADPAEALAVAYATWPAGVRPKAHVSSPRTELRTVGRGKAARLVAPLLEQHADYVSPWDVAAVLRAAPGPLDVMLEAKAKDLALLWLRRQLLRVDPALAAAEEVESDKSLTNCGAGDGMRNRPKGGTTMGEVAKYVTVNAPVEKVYAYWRNFTNFPQFMPNVKDVSVIGGDDTRTHWKVDGPLGTTAEWDAKVVEDVPNEKIAWASTEDSKVKTSGAVRFDARDGQTQIEVSLDYEPPAGAVGEIAAKLFENPSKQIDEALERFQEIVGTWGPSESVAAA